MRGKPVISLGPNYGGMGFPGGSEVKASASNAGDPGSIPGSGRSHGQRSLVGYNPRGRYHIGSNLKLRNLSFKLGQGISSYLIGLPDSSVGKESTCNAGDPGSIPGQGRSTGEGIGYALQYSWASFVA